MRNFISIAVLALSLAAFSQQASAESQPFLSGAASANCWSESGQDIADGQFTIQLETKKIKKSALLKILQAANGKNLAALGYPLVFDDIMFINVEAKDYGVGRARLSRDELKATVHAELDAVLALSKGVTASCVFMTYPAPAIGVHN